MPEHAIASFDVTGWDETTYLETDNGPKLSRAVVSKTFRGDLEGSSTAELLMCRGNPATQPKGAGYIASEVISGRLHGREGSFVLQHGGVMVGSTPEKTFAHVVPGSGTGDLRGISGDAEIQVDAEGRHTLSIAYDIHSP